MGRKGKEKDGRQNRLLWKGESPGKYLLHLCPWPSVRCLQLVAKMLSLRFAGRHFFTSHNIQFLITCAWTEGCDVLGKSSNWITHLSEKPQVGFTPCHYTMLPCLLYEERMWTTVANMKDFSVEMMERGGFQGLLMLWIASDLTRGCHMSHLRIVEHHTGPLCVFLLCRALTDTAAWTYKINN